MVGDKFLQHRIYKSNPIIRFAAYNPLICLTLLHKKYRREFRIAKQRENR